MIEQVNNTAFSFLLNDFLFLSILKYSLTNSLKLPSVSPMFFIREETDRCGKGLAATI